MKFRKMSCKVRHYFEAKSIKKVLFCVLHETNKYRKNLQKIKPIQKIIPVYIHDE